jgi:hypothetical protein
VDRFFLLLSISIIRGIHGIGLQEAGVQARPDFYFSATVLYFCSFTYEPKTQRRLLCLWSAAAACLVLLTLFRWGATVLGLPIAAQWSALVQQLPFRVLTAAQAFFLMIALLLSVLCRLHGIGTRWQRISVYVLAPVIVLLQHRTVWVITIVLFVVLIIRESRLRVRVVWGMVATAVICLVLVFVVFRPHSNTAVLAESLQTAATNDRTFLWRVENWRQMVLVNASVRDLLLGQPYGSSLWREDETNEGSVIDVEVNPHNYFVLILMRMGVLGLLLLVVAYRLGIRGLPRSAAQSELVFYPDHRFWQFVLWSQVLFFITYGPSYLDAMLLGIIVGCLDTLPALSRFPRRDPILRSAQGNNGSAQTAY